MASGIKHLLECNVCSNSFNDKDRVPKGLPCQHTFCLACLKRLKTHGFHTGEDGSVSIRVVVKCPECGQRFLAPSENVANFPNNLTMISLLGAIKKTTALRPSADSDLKSHLSDRVQRLRDEISESAENLVSHLTGLDKQVKVTKTNIKNTFDRIRDAVDRRESYLIGELKDFMARKESIVKHPTEGMAKKLQEMEKFCNEMERRMKVKRDSRLPNYIDHCLELIEVLESEKRQPKWEANFQVNSLDALRATIAQCGKLHLASPESDYSDDEDDSRGHSSGSSRGGIPRQRYRNSSVDTYSMSPPSSEAHVDYNADEADSYSPWSPILSNSGSNTDEAPDEPNIPRYRPKRPEIEYPDQGRSSPNRRRRRITAIQSSFEFEQKYGGLVPLAEPSSTRLPAIGAPPSRSSNSGGYSRLSDASRLSAMSRTSDMTRADYNELDYSHDSVDYEVPDFPALPGPLAVAADRPPIAPPPPQLRSQREDRDEIYSQPFDSEDLLTDDGEDGEYVGAGLAWPLIPRNSDANDLPDGFELLKKPYLQRENTITSMDTDSYVDMDAYHQVGDFLHCGKSDNESMEADPLEVLESLPGMTSDGDITPRHSLREPSRKRNRSNNSNASNEIKETKEHEKLSRSPPTNPAARRKAFVDSHQAEHKHVTPTQSLYEDIELMGPTSFPNDKSMIPRMKNAAHDSEMSAHDSEMSESEPECSRTRNVSRTVSIELPDISSLSFGRNNSTEDPPTELPPIMDAPDIHVKVPDNVDKPLVVVDILQDSGKMRPSSWSPQTNQSNSTTTRLNVNGALYTTVRRSSWSPLSDKEIADAEFERSFSMSEWSSDETSSEEDPYETMSWSMPCGLNTIDKLSPEPEPRIRSDSAHMKIQSHSMSPPKRRSHPQHIHDTCTSTDEILHAQPRPRSYALSRQSRLRQSTDKGESIYWFPPRRLSHKRTSRKMLMRFAAEASTGESMEGYLESSPSRAPPRVPKKPSLTNNFLQP